MTWRSLVSADVNEGSPQKFKLVTWDGIKHLTSFSRNVTQFCVYGIFYMYMFTGTWKFERPRLPQFGSLPAWTGPSSTSSTCSALTRPCSTSTILCRSLEWKWQCDDCSDDEVGNSCCCTIWKCIGDGALCAARQKQQQQHHCAVLCALQQKLHCALCNRSTVCSLVEAAAALCTAEAAALCTAEALYSSSSSSRKKSTFCHKAFSFLPQVLSTDYLQDAKLPVSQN